MKAYTRIITVLTIFLCATLMVLDANSYASEGERIIYAIKPLGGNAEYLDLGLADLEGRKVKLTVFKASTAGFKDTETIYSDQKTFLPIRVERDISWWLGKEKIIEEYNQIDFKVTVTKFKKGKKVSQQIFLADGPISNAILVPFYLREVNEMKVGWSFVFRLPQKYVATIVSLSEVRVGKKKSAAYHFTSIPDKFEIWISNDNARIPLKISGKGGFKYTLLMKERSIPSAN